MQRIRHCIPFVANLRPFPALTSLQGLLQPVLDTQSAWNRQLSTNERGIIDTAHRTATDLVFPANTRQKKYAARVHRALTAVLSSDASLREALIHDVGLTIKDIRVSPDHTKAFVLWESFMGRGAATAAALQRHLPRLKAGVAKAMAARRVPRLEFRRDAKGSEIEALERTLDQIDEEFAADAAENTP